MITILTGNIFTTKCTTIVNTVNCVGIMGAGIAYECRLRYPEMYEKYQTLCKDNLLQIGTLWIYKASNKSILNFPTKTDWKQPSRIEYLEKGLQKFVDTYKEKEITSIAFPLLGASHGGLTQEQSLSTMQRYLSQCDIEIEIWHFDPTATDDITGGNSTYKKLAVQWLNEALCFVSSSVVADSFRLRNRQLLVAANR
jgi:O-acetyl-ADP-ribose deacetylase (regulator of RNase III)